MESLFVTMLVIGVLGTAVYSKIRLDAGWRQAAFELGLGMEEGFFSLPKLSGWVKGYHVAVGWHRNGQNRNGVLFRVQGDRSLPSELSLTKENAGRRFARSVWGRDDLATGDPTFDGEVFVQGPAADTLARLDARARRQIRVALATPRTRVEGREIVRELSGTLSTTSDLVRHIEELVAVAECLRLELEIPDKLAYNVEHETIGEVRLQNLRRVQSMPSHPAAKNASRTACDDRDPRLRLQGAMHLGEERFAVLAALVEPADGSGEASRERVPMPVRIQALRHLVERFDAGRVAPLLRRQLDEGAPRMLQAAVEGAGSLRLAELLPELRRKISQADEEVALAITEAVGRIADETAESDLLQLLDHASLRVQEQAAKALGEHGSVRAVPLLKERAAASHTRVFRRVAQQAVSTIQARLEGAEAGQLALANGTTARAGALSLAGPERGGELALADDPTTGRARAPSRTRTEGTSMVSDPIEDPDESQSPP